MSLPIPSAGFVAAEPSCSIISEYNPQLVSHVSSHSQIQGLNDVFSQDDVFAIICQEINEIAPKLESLGELYSKRLKSARTSRSRSFSKSYNEEYSDILNSKGNACDKLTEILESCNPNGIPKYTVLAYQEYSSNLNHRYNEVRQEVQQQTEQTKKSKIDSNRLNMYISCFSNLEEECGYQEGEDSAQSRLLFQEAKKDMDTVIQILCPDEEVKKELSSTLKVLLMAYMDNLDNTEEQYVEVSLSALSSEHVQCLLRKGVIIPHPHSPGLFRLCVE
uniref:Uncharacterized protein n=1 Tax=Homalodisca liturata TaxID=320908 RepID=A0A1B6HEP0_9HEMI